LLYASSKLISSYFTASGSFSGSAVKYSVYPCSFYQKIRPISTARRAAAVSVVKKGFPVPAEKITTSPFSNASFDKLLTVSLSDRFHPYGSQKPAFQPRLSRADCIASPLITVAIMPI
jgi:hypothetical protein